MKTNASNRSGFTLIELLVVVAILATLMALLVPAVMRARASARTAAIKVEIDMLHMALMNYKNEYGSFPPAVSDNFLPNSPAVKHLMRLFPRTDTLVEGRWTAAQPEGPAIDQLNLAATGALSGGSFTDATSRNNIAFGPDTAIAFWLAGFTSNPASPMYPGSDRKRLYDFDESRRTSTGTPPRFTGQYHISGKPDSWFVYFDSANYLTLPIPTTPSGLSQSFVHVQPDRVLANGVNRTVPAWVTALPPAQQELWYFTISEDREERLLQRPFNADTFQIHCAGIDGFWGTDDDVSNCWTGTRRDFLDSLKNK